MPRRLRDSAFGLLATVQAVGNFAASSVAGLLYTVFSPTVAFGYLAVWMLTALATSDGPAGYFDDVGGEPSSARHPLAPTGAYGG